MLFHHNLPLRPQICSPNIILNALLGINCGRAVVQYCLFLFFRGLRVARVEVLQEALPRGDLGKFVQAP